MTITLIHEIFQCFVLCFDIWHVFNTYNVSRFRPATFPVLTSHMWPEAATLKSTAVYKYRQFIFLLLQVGITL